MFPLALSSAPTVGSPSGRAEGQLRDRQGTPIFTLLSIEAGEGASGIGSWAFLGVASPLEGLSFLD